MSNKNNNEGKINEIILLHKTGNNIDGLKLLNDLFISFPPSKDNFLQKSYSSLYIQIGRELKKSKFIKKGLKLAKISYNKGNLN